MWVSGGTYNVHNAIMLREFITGTEIFIYDQTQQYLFYARHENLTWA